MTPAADMTLSKLEKHLRDASAILSVGYDGHARAWWVTLSAPRPVEAITVRGASLLAAFDGILMALETGLCP